MRGRKDRTGCCAEGDGCGRRRGENRSQGGSGRSIASTEGSAVLHPAAGGLLDGFKYLVAWALNWINLRARLKYNVLMTVEVKNQASCLGRLGASAAQPLPSAYPATLAHVTNWDLSRIALSAIHIVHYHARVALPTSKFPSSPYIPPSHDRDRLSSACPPPYRASRQTPL
jgi:hypothetical protein